jgi:hypothetical protein
MEAFLPMLESEENEENEIIVNYVQYPLHKKSIKHLCPNCNKKKYGNFNIDVESNEYF